MMLPLVLYDILSELPGNNWSANPAKPRFVLSYKDLPFGDPLGRILRHPYRYEGHRCKAKQTPRWLGRSTPSPSSATPNTGALITDSLEIASYLEKTYPEKPIFPNNSEPNDTRCQILHEARSRDVPLPWDEKYDEDWELLEKVYNTAYEWYEKTDGKWIIGNTLSYADIVVACHLLWYKRVLNEDEWARISSWNGGKWAQVLADVEKECKLA
ncbi:hypothetical protein DFJ58DRAFT_746550 [Suillus subalutaceus]|uniref:uncharacterized protein n=1 Tax=Suillus subalutaceus TaxID=48586 RepID=UPI001B8770D1|nr:uncharacterized protein DFJ58DRAFT_746550 [Suillus subalutaceus]KAG1849931.1 hypothetical protein DFJ58DRAFT_746550 [Suillus subalutaceus]